ncbi:uncharacterized protein LOC110186093 [Drosophila serrata]|uniref:uncharacterized protein LOC110186093 n=1 Tax=Drosophila serrata TaxID=7274 RepID=UPI000A1D2E38|nr:uncharacterized protein LOC110186093 [Drosophila serrata]
MPGINKSVSAPDFREPNDLQLSNESFRDTRYHPEPSSEVGRLQFDDAATSFSRIHARMETSTCAFRSYVFVLLGAQVFLSSLQWMGATYRWRPQVTPAERSLYCLLLLLSWTNLTLAFIGFRRLQFTFPLNWIIFGCIFESLTLLVMSVRLIEQDITWPFIVISLGVLLVYTALGLWVPGYLTANLWILILVSMIVLVVSATALGCRLQMRFYVPLSLSVMIFGPWAMYNSQRIFVPKKQPGYLAHQYLEAASRMFINFAFTVGGIVFAHGIAVNHLDVK